jgi:hypothetical protein
MNMTYSILEQAQIIFVFGNLSSKNIKDECRFQMQFQCKNHHHHQQQQQPSLIPLSGVGYGDRIPKNKQK